MSLIDWAGIACRGIVGATFLIAGLAKLSSPRASAMAVAEFGAPAFARPLLRGLPLVEVAVAISLALAVSSWYGASVAAVLLVIFIVAMLVNLARGRRPACNCFGQVRPSPISGGTVVRNVVLLGLAGWLIAAGPPAPSADLWHWVRSLSSHAQQSAALVSVGLLIALRLLLPGDAEAEPEPEDDEAAPAPRRPSPAAPAMSTAGAVPAATPTQSANASSGRRLTGNGLPEGDAAPVFALPDLSGTIHTLESVLAQGTPVVLIFSSPGCESCQALAPRLPPLVATHRDRLTIVLVSRDTAERNLAKLPDPGDLLVLRQQNYEVAEDYDITTSPAGILVGTDGRIASPLAWGGVAILDLIRTHGADTAHA